MINWMISLCLCGLVLPWSNPFLSHWELACYNWTPSHILQDQHVRSLVKCLKGPKDRGSPPASSWGFLRGIYLHTDSLWPFPFCSKGHICVLGSNSSENWQLQHESQKDAIKNSRLEGKRQQDKMLTEQGCKMPCMLCLNILNIYTHMQIKITMPYHFPLTRMTTIKRRKRRRRRRTKKKK